MFKRKESNCIVFYFPNKTMRNDSKHKYYTSMCPWGFGDLEWTVGIKNKSSGSQMQFL